MKTILVTGAAGFIGSHTVEAYLPAGQGADTEETIGVKIAWVLRPLSRVKT